MAATALDANNAAVSHNDAFVANVMGPGATGTAVRAQAPSDSATALKVEGKAKFSTSWSVEIFKGQSRVTVGPYDSHGPLDFLRTLTTDDFILVTLQQNPNAPGKNVKPVWFSHVEYNTEVAPNERSFDIVMTGPVTSTSVRVAFFVMSNPAR